VRNHESGNVGPFYMDGPRAENPSSTASGHYQFLDSTWRRVWQVYAHRPAPTARASQASTYDQSLIAGIVYIKGGKSAWAGSGC
jgi:hypothetical protein